MCSEYIKHCWHKSQRPPIYVVISSFLALSGANSIAPLIYETRKGPFQDADRWSLIMLELILAASLVNLLPLRKTAHTISNKKNCTYILVYPPFISSKFNQTWIRWSYCKSAGSIGIDPLPACSCRLQLASWWWSQDAQLTYSDRIVRAPCVVVVSRSCPTKYIKQSWANHNWWATYVCVQIIEYLQCGSVMRLF